MAKRTVIWTGSAKAERKEILAYWIGKTGSKAYSKKLNKLFDKAIRLLMEFPLIGRITSDPRVRLFVIRDYLLFYE